MPGGTQLFVAGIGAALGLAALAALVLVMRARQRQAAAATLTARRGRGALALKGSRGGAAGKGEFALANPLAVQRGMAPRPPRGPPPGHCRVGFAEYYAGEKR